MSGVEQTDGAWAGPERVTFSPSATAEVEALLGPVDAELARRYPGDPSSRQPVHTVYVPADVFTADTVADWGRQALEALDAHAGTPAALAGALGVPSDELITDVHARVRSKLLREPIEDLRIDFEDGYGSRPDAGEDAEAVRVARLVAAAVTDRSAPPYLGVRFKCLEAAARARAIRTLELFLGTLLAEHGELPTGLVLTLPKVSHPRQVSALVRLLTDFEERAGLPLGRIGFEIQIETTQAILGADGRATVARLIEAAEGRATGLHYGTFDYSAACGVSAAYQSTDHPAADHAKAVMQVAAAGTGVRLSDGSTNVIPTGSQEQVTAAWRLHYGLVRRSLARAYHQGWDLHPAHLPTRYAAVYTFYREGLSSAADRLTAYLAKAGGAVLDEPATARALSGYLLRGLDCGAVDPAEVTALTGLDRPRLEALRAR
ncbi:aldolase/citrate lyase family protein [Kitasatospora sp. RB6PN24]|uniref:DUF6986 family protein n=1 Tax=Kitasatospora humi TaxID=2893891 RepID=UPI001E3272A6|nr:aldolase/citrate lyase family protein [Kitasatospora humi]MCC9312187.1 aldolase/citrate lyase family protein [Kitasatospora humi]